jgi:hypothetical protein
VADAITLARAGSVKTWAVFVLSLVLGVIGLGIATSNDDLLVFILAVVLIVVAALMAIASLAASDVLLVDDDAIARDLDRKNQWRLRWAHVAAVRFTNDAVLLVPLPEVADHPQIAPALEPQAIDGQQKATFAVRLDPGKTAAARLAITRHAPHALLAQSSPRPPST